MPSRPRSAQIWVTDSGRFPAKNSDTRDFPPRTDASSARVISCWPSMKSTHTLWGATVFVDRVVLVLVGFHKNGQELESVIAVGTSLRTCIEEHVDFCHRVKPSGKIPAEAASAAFASPASRPTGGAG